MTKISIICGSFHKEEISKMLELAEQEAETLGLEIAEVVWVPGSMEIPLAIDRQLRKDEIDAVACLGIIEKGQTKHGLAMGQAVARAGAQGGGVHRERPRDVVGPLPRAPRPSGHPAHDKPH